MATDLDYLEHLTRDSARFRAALHPVPSGARVPTCPDWDADDLLWHLGTVQWFWSQVVGRPITSGADVAALEHPERPPDRAGLEAFHERVSEDLVRALAGTPPQTTAWTWSREQTAGFSRRRQAHEALIHRLDAELTAGERTPMDATLCADGVDEALRIMYGGHPDWGVFTAEDGATVRLRTTDTGDTWLVTLGRFVGHEPEEDTDVDEADLGVADRDPGGEAAATVSAAAADLDCWLWHRPPVGTLDRTGDASVLDRLESVMSPGIR
jgi:uncharacterized protein (TIGR03083 family)